MLNEFSIRCFLMLARTLNFTKAAKALNVSQQSVSQNIAKMEDDLGFPLFIRSRRHVELSQQGQVYWAFFSDVYEREQRLRRDCLGMEPQQKKSIRVGFQDWTVLGGAAGLSVSKLHEKLPSLNLDISRCPPGILVERFRKGDLDIIVLFERWAPKDPELNIMRMQKSEYLILTAKRLLPERQDIRFEDIAKFPFIIDNYGGETGEESKSRLLSELAALGYEPPGIRIAADREAAFTAAEVGQGCVLSSTMSRILADTDFVAFKLGVYDHLVCVWHRSRYFSAVDIYADCLINAYKERPFEMSQEAKSKVRDFSGPSPFAQSGLPNVISDIV